MRSMIAERASAGRRTRGRAARASPPRRTAPKGLSAACPRPRLGPGRGDEQDLFVQPRRARPVERKPAEQDDARLRAGTDDDRGARQAGREALAQEARQQAAHEPMLEVELKDALDVDAVVGQRRPERDGAQRRVGAPVLEPLRSFAAADAQIVERLRPAAADEGGIVGIEPEKRDAVDLARPRGVERGPGARHRLGDDLFAACSGSTPTRSRDSSRSSRSSSSSFA